MSTLTHQAAAPPPPDSHPSAASPTRRTRVGRLFRGRPDDPRWARPALWSLLAATAGLYLWNLSASGYANDFYAAAVKAGTQDLRAWLFASLDSSNAITVDKPTDDTLLNIYNSQGVLVRQEVLGGMEAGEVRFGWDGRNEAGESLPAGLYRFEALASRDGEVVALKTSLGANVNSVTIGATGDMTLNVDGVGPLSISDVKEIL